MGKYIEFEQQHNQNKKTLDVIVQTKNQVFLGVEIKIKELNEGYANGK